jgi:hypothetical protein
MLANVLATPWSWPRLSLELVAAISRIEVTLPS